MTDSQPIDLRAAAAREAVLKTLLDAVKAEYEEARADVQFALDQARETVGATQVNAELPDGTVVAKVSLTDPKPAAQVTDEKAFTDWVVANYPTEKATRIVTEVRDAFRTQLLAEATAAGVPVWADRETGEVHTVPGVEIRATRARTHSVRFAKDGRDQVAAAWREGRLGNTAPTALTSQ
jgi:hypothetical protein